MTSHLLCLCLSASLGLNQAAPEAIPLPKGAEPASVKGMVLAPGCPQPIALCDFCKSFKPAPGHYEVLFLHPVKCCPVWVCFTLPPGCAKVCCSKREIVFDYGCRDKDVVIRFKLLCGGVRVWD
jgi:hypothetical protein